MDNLNEIIERVHVSFAARTKARDQALIQARQLTRYCAHAIRAIHRDEIDNAREKLGEARELVEALRTDLVNEPTIYYSGYSQDAIKEYVEASVTLALICDKPLPEPEELEVEYSTYLKGLAEVVGELRRRCLDLLRHGYSQEVERLLGCMDEIYAVLVTVDYADAITFGLRRQTDMVRGILERTRGDLTISLREEQLIQSMDDFLEKFSANSSKSEG
ncbi:MAG: haloacid dehalogenase [Anaerolineaceae bacterium]|nr:haloacid dehalogenase [Anaerolineaceae bacterium]